MNRKLKLLTGAVLSAAVGTASAAIISFEDDDLDFHLRPDANGVLQPVTPLTANRNLVTGDVLIAVLEYNSRQGVPYAPSQELTGIAVIEATQTATGYDFNPYSGGFNAAVNTFAGNAVNVTGGQAGGGAMLSLWLDNSPELAISGDLVTTAGGFSCGALGACLDQASDGVIFEVDGFEFDAAGAQTDNALWTALSTTSDTGTILNAPTSTIFGFFNAELSILDVGVSGADDNEPFAGTLGPIDVLLSGTIYGGGFNQWVNTGQRDTLVASGFVATTDNQLQKSIPVPAPLALFGLGLLGFAFSKRRLT